MEAIIASDMIASTRIESPKVESIPTSVVCDMVSICIIYKMPSIIYYYVNIDCRTSRLHGSSVMTDDR